MSQPINPSAFDPRRLADLARSVSATGPAAPSYPPRVDELFPSTVAGGHQSVDAVLGELERAGQLPPDQQIPVYESVHRTLQETLRSIEQN